MGQETASLQATLDAILQRLSCLESSIGIQATPSAAAATAATTTTTTAAAIAATTSTTNTPPSLSAFDQHISQSLKPFLQTCHALPGLSDTIAPSISTIWHSMRDIIQVASQCRKPAGSNLGESLARYLEPIQSAMSDIRKAKLDRSYDWHIKAIMEMLACVSWVVMSPPPAPSSFIKDTVGATDFWANKIRKEYKGKEQQQEQIAFCDTLKALILDLSAYVKEYHLSGLMWNPHGMDLVEYHQKKINHHGDGGGVSKDSKKDEKVSVTQVVETNKSGTNNKAVPDFMKELASKRTSDGNSAATGLKKVSRDQQTWRKEYKVSNASATSSSSSVVTSVKPSAVKAAQKGDGGGIGGKTPKCQFQAVGNKWVVEYHTQESNPNGVCTVEIRNVKEQVYIYKCNQATIQLKGKLKSVIMDSCHKTNLLFDTAISSCEIVNCQKVQIQSTGICPSFAIDKTDGCLVYLSPEGVCVSNFVTSKSSEMNVSWLDEKSGEQKEAPIPEQFVHRLVNGSITSDVSDLYH